jgi:hypothetical protein
MNGDGRSKPVSWWQKLACGFFLYSLVLIPLNAFVAPTDYPRQPGDGWHDLGKIYIAVCTAWLIVRVCERSKQRLHRLESQRPV